MAIINEKDQQAIRDMFQVLESQVKLLFFGRQEECQYCHDIEQLLTELSALSDKLLLERKEIETDRELADKLHIEKAPAILLLGEEERDYGIRFYGIPAGYEFSALLDDIRMVSLGESGLEETTRRALSTLTDPVNLKVFVTPT